MNRRIPPPTQFLNRELGILAFQRRVLAQAADETVPLLERLRFITIVSSNLPAIEPGMKVVYLSDLSGRVLDTDIVLPSGRSGTARGHVVLDLTTQRGRVTLSGGTGKFTQLRADVDVWFDGTLWHWDGSYRYGPSGDGGD